MLHQAEILAITCHEVIAIVGELDLPREILEVDREACVDWVTPAVNDTGTRKSGMNEGNDVEVLRSLVRDPLRGGRDGREKRTVIPARTLHPCGIDQAAGTHRESCDLLAPKGQLAPCRDFRMARKNLLYERR